MDRHTHTSRRTFALLFLVLLVATGLRLIHLPQLPVGLHYDEAANGVSDGGRQVLAAMNGHWEDVENAVRRSRENITGGEQ